MEGDTGLMLSREQQREILAVGLLALALFVLLSLLPTSLLGARGGEWFPSGNAMGVLGNAVRRLLAGFFGGTAYLVPVLLALAGVRVGRWMAPERSLRLGILVTGLLILVPVMVWVLGPEDPGVAAGWLGTRLGGPLVELVGWLGALLFTGVALVALSVGTLGWNPLRTLGRGVATGGELAGRTARTLAEKSKELAEKRREAAQARRGEMGAPMEEEPSILDELAEAEGVAAEGGAGAEAPGAGGEGAPGMASAGAPAEGAGTGGELDGGVAEAPPEGVAEDEDVPGAESDAGEMPEHGDAAALARVSLPDMELLSDSDDTDRAGMERELDRLGEVLVEKLRTFNVQCELGGRTTGPVVTQFEVIPAPGVKVNRIANLDADLALALKAQSVRIVAPIPGKGAVGVEIPNPKPEIVHLRNILKSSAFQKAKGELPLALGKDLTGRPFVTDLTRMPHVLIAGATGSGKSVCVNTLVTSLIYKHTPETLRFLMVDPKMVELSIYARLPHLRHPVVTDPREAAGVLKWAVLEMERRYELLSKNHVRSIAEFNRKVTEGALLHRVQPSGPEGDEDRWIYSDGVLPYIVVVVDELADLMMQVQSEVERPLIRLAQKARAIGIHLIVATQRPTTNVITGLIKANFPSRIAFRVASKVDSRTILDQNGADALLGNGDMLFLPPGQSEPVRIQGAYLSTEDTERLMTWYIERAQRLLEGEETAAEAVSTAEPDILDEVRSHEMVEAASAVEEIAGDWDDLFRAAAEVCIQNGAGSTSLLQRRLSIGYGRAARIVDQLHDAGVLGPSDGSKGREVLVTYEDLDQICGPGGGGGG
ncbi:MAG: DNA translocase FtsK 4TM domain-containing protein [Gemmatimonadota bacterium]